MIKLININKIYFSKHDEIRALNNISLNVAENEFIVIRGASGSGKSTLLLTLGAMLSPTNGKVLFGNKDIYSISGMKRNKFRAANIGFVFQMFHLLPYLTLLENVYLPSLGKEISKAERLLDELGLGDRINHKPSALSAGEKQRTAVARALINRPKIILADEPTGNLDPENAVEVINKFSKFHKSGGTVIIVSHGHEADKFADRIFKLKSGKLFEE